MELKLVTQNEDAIRLEVVGKLTRDGWSGSRDLLTALCGEDVYSRVVLLNLSRSLYLDSTGVEWLLNYHKKFTAGGGRLICHSANLATQQLLKLMRLDQILEIETSDATAMARINDRKAQNEQPNA